MDAHPGAAFGNQVLLLQDGQHKAILAEINAEGQFIWSKSYGKASQNLSPACFSIAKNGFVIYFSEPLLSASVSLSSQVLITGPLRKLDCAETNTIPEVEKAIWSSRTFSVNAKVNGTDGGSFVVVPITVVPETFGRQATVDCQKFVPCCPDIVDTNTITKVSICNGDTYKLPDRTEVRYTGNYDITLQTAKGCDSTVYYHVDVIKNPSELQPLADTCLGERDSLLLKATPGFGTYHWMNTTQTEPSFKVTNAGSYYLYVSNECGIKKDTVFVYKDCNFPIYVPNAFTPDGDGLNDMFGLPAQNKNRLLSLTIYNRWGEVVFLTTSRDHGWDGTFKGRQQPPGAYVYYLQMEGLQGKPLTQKGTVVLIR